MGRRKTNQSGGKKEERKMKGPLPARCHTQKRVERAIVLLFLFLSSSIYYTEITTQKRNQEMCIKRDKGVLR